MNKKSLTILIATALGAWNAPSYSGPDAEPAVDAVAMTQYEGALEKRVPDAVPEQCEPVAKETCVSDRFGLEEGQTMADAVFAVSPYDFPCMLNSPAYSTALGSTDVVNLITFFDADGPYTGELFTGENGAGVFDTHVKFKDGQKAFRFEKEFTQGFRSRIGSDGTLKDFINQPFQLGGNEYLIAGADIDTANETIDLLLLRNATSGGFTGGDTVVVNHKTSEGGEPACKDYAVSLEYVVVSKDITAHLKVNGQDIKVREGGVVRLSDGRNFALQKVVQGSDENYHFDFTIADEKLEGTFEYNNHSSPDGNPLKINDKYLEDAAMIVDGFINGKDFQLQDARYTVRVGGSSGADAYLPGQGSKAPDHSKCLSGTIDEPEALLGLDICHAELPEEGGSSHSVYFARVNK